MIFYSTICKDDIMVSISHTIVVFIFINILFIKLKQIIGKYVIYFFKKHWFKWGL